MRASRANRVRIMRASRANRVRIMRASRASRVRIMRASYANCVCIMRVSRANRVRIMRASRANVMQVMRVSFKFYVPVKFVDVRVNCIYCIHHWRDLCSSCALRSYQVNIVCVIVCSRRIISVQNVGNLCESYAYHVRMLRLLLVYVLPVVIHSRAVLRELHVHMRRTHGAKRHNIALFKPAKSVGNYNGLPLLQRNAPAIYVL